MKIKLLGTILLSSALILTACGQNDDNSKKTDDKKSESKSDKKSNDSKKDKKSEDKKKKKKKITNNLTKIINKLHKIMDKILIHNKVQNNKISRI